MIKTIKLNKKYLWFILDLILINISLLSALLVRFGFDIIEYFHYYRDNILLISLLYLIFSCLFKLYNFFWRYVSMKETFYIIFVVSLTFLSARTLNNFLFGNNLPRTVFFISFFFSMSTIIGNKLLWRLYHESKWKIRQSNNKILVVGAGDAGEVISREIEKRPSLGSLVGFVDDDLNKHGMSIHGKNVLGTTENIPQLVDHHSVDRIIIAMPSASGKQIRRIVNLIPDRTIDVKTLPGLYELVDGQVSYSKVRNLEIEDILGREPINLNNESILNYLEDKTILITGAGGSIGSEISRQVCRFNPNTVVLLDKSENNLYNIFWELKNNYENIKLIPLLLDISNKIKLASTFQKIKIDVIFHAAAYKHVPILEYYPEEAVWNNIVATANIASISNEYNVDKMIMISSDKAINPSSVMGASKRVAEMIVMHYGNISKTHFSAVRFGNVLGSSGSVVPLFRKQITQGGPVTVTDKEVKRYFMTIPEATQLVIQAGALGDSGHVFVLDMGEPIRVYDLAVEMIKLMGFEPEKDIEIKFVGLRPGEKLFEELLTEGEKKRPTGITAHEKIFIAKVHKVNGKRLLKDINDLEQLALKGDNKGIIRKLKEIIPNYKPNRDLKKMHDFSW